MLFIKKTFFCNSPSVVSNDINFSTRSEQDIVDLENIIINDEYIDDINQQNFNHNKLTFKTKDHESSIMTAIYLNYNEHQHLHILDSTHISKHTLKSSLIVSSPCQLKIKNMHNHSDKLKNIRNYLMSLSFE